MTNKERLYLILFLTAALLCGIVLGEISRNRFVVTEQRATIEMPNHLLTALVTK